jgi:divalent anion:Na+ symporter, DASS family
MNGKGRSATSQIIRGLIAIAIGIIIWNLPAPAGVKKEAMHLLAIFVATIVGLILTPLPMGAVVIIGVMLTGVTETLKVGQILSGFANNTVWLIVAAFLLTRGFINQDRPRKENFLSLHPDLRTEESGTGLCHRGQRSRSLPRDSFQHRPGRGNHLSHC